jgi:hypothetical protein
VNGKGSAPSAAERSWRRREFVREDEQVGQELVDALLIILVDRSTKRSGVATKQRSDF